MLGAPRRRRRSRESISEAAQRELYEETGIAVADVGACLAVVQGAFTFYQRDYRQHEHIFRILVDEPTYEPASLDGELERAAYLGHRWYSIADVLATDENLYPPGSS